MDVPEEVTRLLADLSAGKEGVSEKLIPLVYDELRSIASRYMRQERADHTLQTTALVHEAYIRLSGGQEMEWNSRAHFFGIAAQTMRRILIDYARKRSTDKKGGGWRRESLEEADVFIGEPSLDLIALNTALDQLSDIDPKMVRVVELRFFGGLSVEETAKVLSISTRTVKQDWRLAKAWLQQQMSKGA